MYVYISGVQSSSSHWPLKMNPETERLGHELLESDARECLCYSRSTAYTRKGNLIVIPLLRRHEDQERYACLARNGGVCHRRKAVQLPVSGLLWMNVNKWATYLSFPYQASCWRTFRKSGPQDLFSLSRPHSSYSASHPPEIGAQSTSRARHCRSNSGGS
jgi:hypothetical protein